MNKNLKNNLMITFKNVYTNRNKENILIIYNISNKHYIGLKLNKEKIKNYIYLNSIDFYCNITEIQDYKYKDFSNALYIKGKAVRINEQDFKKISKLAKEHYIKSIYNKTYSNTAENLLFNKWMNDKYDLNNR